VRPITAAAEEPNARVCQEPDLRGFKSFCLGNLVAARTGITCIVGPNVRQVQCCRRPCLVMGEQGAKSLRAARWRTSSSPEPSLRAPWPGRDLVDHRQHRRRVADRLHRGHDQPDDVRNGGSEYANQRHVLPPLGYPGASFGLRYRPRDARHRGPGAARTILRATAEDDAASLRRPPES